MIRPITVICWILALGSGLYLYRAKHEVELMDKHIEQVAKETTDVRADSRRLLDDWLRLGEPEQLHKYSDEYLGLKPIAPTQFARASDLPARLPPPEALPPEPTTPVASADDVAQAEPAGTDADQADADDLPLPPIPPPAPIPVMAAATVPVVATVPLQARPVTPRAATTQLEDRPHVADEPHAPTPRLVLEEPRPAVATRTAPASVRLGGAAGERAAGLPPLQAQASPPRTVAVADPQPAEADRPVREPMRVIPPRGQETTIPGDRGLPPLQAQGPNVPPRAPARSYAGPTQPVGRQVPWQPEANVAETRPIETRPIETRPIETRPIEPRPIEARRELPPAAPRFGDPRGPRMTQQGGGSLLGMQRGGVPLPLPAPVPVNASWPPQASPGR